MRLRDQLAPLVETVTWYLGQAELARLDGKLDRLRRAESDFRNDAIKVLEPLGLPEADSILQEILIICEPIPLEEVNTRERIQRLDRIRIRLVALAKGSGHAPAAPRLH